MREQENWWFDGDYSECYYAWGHVDKKRFAEWVWTEDGGQTGPVLAKEVEHLWAIEDDEERFHFVKRGWGLRPPENAKPITRFRP